MLNIDQHISKEDQDIYYGFGVVIVFLFTNLYGLIQLDWSGLHVIYLMWFDLVLLVIYASIRFHQIVDTPEWHAYEETGISPKKVEYAKAHFGRVIGFRITILVFYLFIISSIFSFIEYNDMSNNEFKGFNSVDRKDGSVFSDPFFVLALFLLVQYYVRALLGKPDLSKEGIRGVIINNSLYDTRFFAYTQAAIIYYPLASMLNYKMNDHNSHLYLVAITMIVLRALSEFVHLLLLKDYISTLVSYRVDIFNIKQDK